MKAKIQKNGAMVITPTSAKEDLLLRSWYRENKERVINTAIIFNRFPAE